MFGVCSVSLVLNLCVCGGFVCRFGCGVVMSV